MSRTLPLEWLSNDPQAAAQLRAADAEYDAAVRATAHMALADKIPAMKAAKIARAKAYADIAQTL